MSTLLRQLIDRGRKALETYYETGNAHRLQDAHAAAHTADDELRALGKAAPRKLREDTVSLLRACLSASATCPPRRRMALDSANDNGAG